LEVKEREELYIIPPLGLPGLFQGELYLYLIAVSSPGIAGWHKSYWEV